ncbi:DUF5689 domain-containing protein [Ascidiimonas aurantiaca]|uniref:DUF5689 domain-containing protein n=1 Tax=Ascidiimonas aurantiaca TaxID=1685432 RepID=UPI0030EE4AB2
MKNNLFYIQPFVWLVLLVCQSCVEDEFKPPSRLCGEDLPQVNATIEQIKGLYRGEIVRIQEDLVIDGYVTSTDKAGNFFGTLHFQDSPVAPSQGFQIEIDLRDMHLFFDKGQKVTLKLKGLYLGQSGGIHKLGGLFPNAGGSLSIGRLPATLVHEHVFASCEDIAAITPTITPVEELDDTMLNTLVTVTGVEVSPEALCLPFAEPKESSERPFQSCEGGQITLVNSGFSDFQSAPMPTGSGSVTGVLGKSGSRYQLTIRDLQDINFEAVRCDGLEFTCEPPAPTTTIQAIKNTYSGSLTPLENDKIIQATVVASDSTQNVSRAIYIQDSTGGIRLELDGTRLYTKNYNRGRILTLKTHGLSLAREDGEWKIGRAFNDRLEPIREEDLYRYIYKEDSIAVPRAKITQLTSLNESDIGSLVTLQNVQFFEENKTFVISNSDTFSTLTDCEGRRIQLRTNRSASFGDKVQPSGNGDITGILSMPDGEYQLMIRDQQDTEHMTGDRCNIFEQASLWEIRTVRDLLSGENFQIADNIKIRGVVISDKDSGHLPANQLVIQDNTAGILLSFSSLQEVPAGTMVEVALIDTFLTQGNSVLTINGLGNSNILSRESGDIPEPKPMTFAQVLKGMYESELVVFNDVQFNASSGTFLEMEFITNCNGELPFWMNPEATFANDEIPPGKGKITGIMTFLNKPGLMIRGPEDINFTGVYRVCFVNESVNVIISELADPNNEPGARFVELYNAGDIDVDLEGWQLLRYTNASTEVSSVLDLSGYRISAGSTLVLSPNAEIFESVYGFPPDVVSGANGPADSNGDDNLVLVDGNGNTVDIFGVVGEDGSGTNHEFEDGRAVRSMVITEGRSSYDFSEWTLYNDTGGAGTINMPQNAPQDFTPGRREE